MSGKTKNAVRYQEQHPIDTEAKVGAVYVRKAALAQLDRWSLERPYPLDIRVTSRGPTMSELLGVALAAAALGRLPDSGEKFGE